MKGEHKSHDTKTNHGLLEENCYRKYPWMGTVWWLVVGSNFLNRRWGILEGCVVVLAPFARRTVILYQNAFVPQAKIQLAIYTCSLFCSIVLSVIV